MNTILVLAFNLVTDFRLIMINILIIFVSKFLSKTFNILHKFIYAYK